jgi:hypothetical protein
MEFGVETSINTNTIILLMVAIAVAGTLIVLASRLAK